MILIRISLILKKYFFYRVYKANQIQVKKFKQVSFKFIYEKRQKEGKFLDYVYCQIH